MVYTCKSYRCPSPECQRVAAHTDFARIDAALKRPDLDPAGFVFFVLTIDQNDHFGTASKPYKDEQEAFKRLSANTRFFLRRLRLRQKKRGERVLDNEWVGTVEVQRNGWPHMNLMVYAPELAEQLREEQQLGPHDPRRRRHRAQITDPWLLQAVTETNWGTISTAEGVRDAQALAGYIVKLGGEFCRSAGEISKITQAPSNARMKLRRIRAGKGFLPPQGAQQRDGDWTGVMMRRKSEWGTMTVGPMIEPDQVKMVGETPEEQRANYEQYARGVRLAMELERGALEEEEQLRRMVDSGGVNRVLAHKVLQQQRRNLRLIRSDGSG
jgi:hypothetical protein